MRALVLLLMLAAPLVAAPPEDDVRVSVAPVPYSGDAPADGYRPREGQLCNLQVTVQNRSSKPVVVHQVLLRADGTINAETYGDPDPHEAKDDFHGSQVFCAQLEEEGDTLKIALRYDERSSGTAETPPYWIARGENTTRLNWVTPDGILLPGQSVSRKFAWLPAKPDGDLTFEAKPEVSVLRWSPEVARAIWFQVPGQRFPPPPAWVLSGETPMPPPELPPFWVQFTRPRQWPEKPEFQGAVIDRGASGAIARVPGHNRILVEPGTPPLKSLLVQTRRKPERVAWSETAKAWFLCSKGHTWIVTPTRRLELNSDVGDFLLKRVLGGTDGEPWEIVQEFAMGMAIRLAGTPEAPATRGKKKRWLVPAIQLIDRLAEADRLGLEATGDGFRTR